MVRLDAGDVAELQALGVVDRYLAERARRTERKDVTDRQPLVRPVEEPPRCRGGRRGIAQRRDELGVTDRADGLREADPVAMQPLRIDHDLQLAVALAP